MADRPAAGAAGAGVRPVRGGWRGKRGGEVRLDGRETAHSGPTEPQSTGSAAFGGTHARVGRRHRPKQVYPAPYSPEYLGNVGPRGSTPSAAKAGKCLAVLQRPMMAAEESTPRRGGAGGLVIRASLSARTRSCLPAGKHELHQTVYSTVYHESYFGL